ncbi:DUF86 domain-containing protein [Patescibacteria group bacterium]|nr:DUF86 domain-containing protein [Patescibacteria group bacterium]MBU2259248.1 DUF86 domain-containing protein [Patescibacteria group bacterium]
MFDAIDRIEEYLSVVSSCSELKKDVLRFDGIVRQLSIIGEAARHLSDDFFKRHADFPLAPAISMRNKLIHEYIDVKPEIVWQTCQEDLPQLKEVIVVLIEETEKS